jgi:two-component system response regulator AtoC
MEKLVFIVDDEKAVSKLVAYWVKERWGYRAEVFENATDMLNNLSMEPDVILLDIMLPDINGVEVLKELKRKNEDLPVIMLSAQNDVQVAVESLRFGAYDYFQKPLDMQKLEPAIKNAIKSYELNKELKSLKEEVKREYNFNNIISGDKRMQDVFRLVSKVLDNDITVLIHGESGTGKELIARAIHYNGSRKDKPFVVVNCASIPRELLESELFGHEKGAFTGAYQRKIGKFELAREGTIFLDEIGEMELSLQAKILRVIQYKEFERVGGTETIKTNARIISATNRDLKQAVEQKQFREDLYYRLNSFPIVIPPLRQRRGDILILIEHFIKEFNKKFNKNTKGFTKKALKFLYDYDWPGNVRELENTIERCVILAERETLDVADLPPHIKSYTGAMSVDLNGGLFSPDMKVIPLEKLKEEAIKHALKVAEGNIVEAARMLQVGRATIYRLIEKYNIDAKQIIKE